MPTTQEIRTFYNGFLPQLATENERHKRIYKSLDLLPKGKVLDIGCGAGLTSKRLADGGRTVIAVDFSPVAIAYAKEHNNHEQIQYICTDILKYQTDEIFDVICLIDVLEHLDCLWELMDLIENVSQNETIIYLNIPYDKTIKYLRINFPNVLQPIDQPRETGTILSIFEHIGFIPFKMELYWMEYIEYFFCTMDKFNLFMDRTYQILRRDTNG